MPEAVYFVQTLDSLFVKIGFSTNLRKRIINLQQTARPTDVEMIGWIPGSRQDEQSLHFRFRCDRVRREWFRSSESIRQFLKTANLKTLDEFPRQTCESVKIPNLPEHIRIKGRWIELRKATASEVAETAEKYRVRIEQDRKTLQALDRISRVITIYAKKDPEIMVKEVLAIREVRAEMRQYREKQKQ